MLRVCVSVLLSMNIKKYIFNTAGNDLTPTVHVNIDKNGLHVRGHPPPFRRWGVVLISVGMWWTIIKLFSLAKQKIFTEKRKHSMTCPSMQFLSDISFVELLKIFKIRRHWQTNFLRKKQIKIFAHSHKMKIWLYLC